MQKELLGSGKADKILASSLLDYYVFHYLGLEIPQHQRRWCRALEEDEDLLVLAPRDHGKTTIFCRAYPEFMSLYNPNLRILILSKTYRQAEKSLDLIETDLTQNPAIRHDFAEELADFRRKGNMLFFQSYGGPT